MKVSELNPSFKKAAIFQLSLNEEELQEYLESGHLVADDMESLAKCVKEQYFIESEFIREKEEPQS